MNIQVSRITEPDIPGAITAIQKAFENDPYALWVYSDRENLSLVRNRVSLGNRCRWGMRNGLFYVAKDPDSVDPEQVVGVAMWMPPKAPGSKEGWSEWLSNWRLYFQQISMNLWYGRGGLNIKRYYIWKSKQAEAQSEIWTDEKGYYFLNIMVVLPDQQGKGIGRSLAQEITNKADTEGRKCYLESSRDVPNMKIYESYGFHFVKQIDCDDGGVICPLFCMVRDPKTIT
ncbi:acyl-CoA N-acyltransferase [Calycina marina]|uniref:Acyl-CoA N-acyltransferase n=1 Tax=Calycina marina TaxID=1763456 RepID=A0A9P7Z696_9HELO|nr:acyl-CoA N-acyltransferase [Calycina marina]